MPLTNQGAINFAAALIGDNTYSLFNNANAHLAVGTSSTAFSAAQTALVAQKDTRVAMADASYPSRSSGVLTFRSVFGTSAWNDAWNEWGVFNHATTGQMLSRKVESLGTKGPSASWQLTVALTVAAA